MLLTWLALLALQSTPDAGVTRTRLLGPLEAVWVEPAALVVVPLVEERCVAAGHSACEGFPDHRVLRGLELSTGDERWTSERFPILVGRMMSGGRVTAVLAMASSVNAAAVLDPASGQVLAECEVRPQKGDRLYASLAGFRQAWLSDGAVLVSTYSLVSSGWPGIRRTPLRRLEASSTSCTLTLKADDDLVGPVAPGAGTPQRGVTLTQGQDEDQAWVDVRVGGRQRRVQTVLRRGACPPIADCPPKP